MNKILILILVILFSFNSTVLAYYPTAGWHTSTPEGEGIDSAGLAKMYHYILDKPYNAHSLLFIRNGNIVSEAYFHPYTKDTMANIHSCTKSIVSALIGIAIQEGYIKDVEQKVLDFFPEIEVKNLSPEKQRITIHHLLTMSSGLATKYPDTGDEMCNSKNWTEFVLNLKMDAEPGTKFNYSDCDAHLAAAILQKATGMSVYKYAESHLFQPMGMNVYWPADPQGIHYGYGEINMTPRDLAKFGYLFLNKGVWEEKQLVPKQWVAESTKVHTKTNWGDNYGYFWWSSSLDGFYAMGSGGQYMYVLPNENLVAVNTNGLNHGESLTQLSKFADCIKPQVLPENPEALSELHALETKVATSPLLSEKPKIPAIAEKISGKVFAFPQNKPNIKEIVLDLSRSDIAIVRLTTFNGQHQEYSFAIDGGYVKDDSRQIFKDTVFYKGYWQDDKTFAAICEKGEKLNFYMTFEQDSVSLRLTDRGMIKYDDVKGYLK